MRMRTEHTTTTRSSRPRRPDRSAAPPFPLRLFCLLPFRPCFRSSGSLRGLGFFLSFFPIIFQIDNFNFFLDFLFPFFHFYFLFFFIFYHPYLFSYESRIYLFLFLFFLVDRLLSLSPFILFYFI